jgi:hypothetical protein
MNDLAHIVMIRMYRRIGNGENLRNETGRSEAGLVRG